MSTTYCQAAFGTNIDSITDRSAYLPFSGDYLSIVQDGALQTTTLSQWNEQMQDQAVFAISDQPQLYSTTIN